MKFAYKFSNLLGTVYKGGNLVFTDDGNSVLSPVGNRISSFDLLNNTSCTLPIENSKNVKVLAVAPNSDLLISVGEDGRCLLINRKKGVVLGRMALKEHHVTCLRFSPCGLFFSVASSRRLFLYRSPSLAKSFQPFRLVRSYGKHMEIITCLDWSADSRYIITGSADLTCRIVPVMPDTQLIPVTLSGHRDYIVSCYFSQANTVVYTISRDGALFIWQWSEREVEVSGKKKSHLSSYSGKWQIVKKHFFFQDKIVCTDFARDKSLLVVGFANGIFGLYTLPDCSTVHTLSITQNAIDAVTINKSGEWLAFGSSKLGQLLVWEWQSETYVLKQQGHFYDMNSLAYSPNGKVIVTGGDDGKVKVWNASNGFCFVTFKEHTSAVNCVAFSPKGKSNVMFSAGDDGCVRAYDLVRYRNFRTFTSPEPTSFSVIAPDPSGEILCGGSKLDGEIYVWSVQTGKLLDVLKGHEGPLSCLSFHPSKALLASGSWDKTVRLWQVFSGVEGTESLLHSSEVLAVSYRPDGKEICSATLDGNLNFWDCEEGELKHSIEGRKDIAGGRLLSQKTTSASASSNAHFNTICYSADGKCILAAGDSKYICIYNIEHKVLLKKFQISLNLSMDGVLDFLNSKKMTEAGAIDMIDDEDEVTMRLKQQSRSADHLPGVSKGSFASRSTPPAIRSTCVQFSPTGRSFAASTTEGLLLYSLDEALIFDPFELDLEINPENIYKTLADGNYVKAFVMSFNLNEPEIIQKVYEGIPIAQVRFVVADLPIAYVPKLLNFVAKQVGSSMHIEFGLMWCNFLFEYHGTLLQQQISSNVLSSAFRDLHKNISRQYKDLAAICDDNQFTLDYLSALSKLQSNESVASTNDPDGDEMMKEEYLEEEEDEEDPGWDQFWGPNDFADNSNNNNNNNSSSDNNKQQQQTKEQKEAQPKKKRKTK